MKLLILLFTLCLIQIISSIVTETYLEPYKGTIITANNYSFQAGRIGIGVKTNVTKERVEELITPYNGRIVGWLKNINSYVIELPPDQRESAIEGLEKLPEIDYAQRISITYGNDYFQDPQTDHSFNFVIYSIAIIAGLALLVLLVKVAISKVFKS